MTKRIIIWKPTPSLPLLDQFLEKVEAQPDGCWTSSPTITFLGQTKPNYIWSFLLFVARIERGRHIHHTCFKHDCCNPTHLVSVTPSAHRKLHWEEDRKLPVLPNRLLTNTQRKILHLPSSSILDTRLKQFLLEIIE